MRMTLPFLSPPDQTLRFLHRCSWNIFEDGDLKSMLALIAPTKTPRLKCSFVHVRFGHQDKETLDDTNLNDITLPNGRFIPVISEFRYLGSYITRDGSDTKDVRARINSAARAFGALSKCIFQSRHVKRDAKRAVYERLILSICLYGCESWCLKETLYTELRQFHARCVRSMSRTNLHHTWIHRISTKNLEKELGLDSMNNYIARRQLRWLGHVSRMPFDRLPRRMLSSWFPAPRCRGATKMTYGRTMKKAMATFDINPQNWYELAADRVKWHAMIK